MTNVISLSMPQRRHPFIPNANALFSVLLTIAGTTRMFFGSKKTQIRSTYWNVQERQYPKTPWLSINPSTNSCLQKKGHFLPNITGSSSPFVWISKILD